MYSLTFRLNFGQSSVLPENALGIFIKLFLGDSSSDMIVEIDGGGGDGNGGFLLGGCGVYIFNVSDVSAVGLTACG